MRNVKNLSCLVQIPIVALKAIKLHQAKVSWWDILDAPFVGLQIMSVLALMTYWRRKITNWINFVRVATNLLKHKQMRWYYHIKKKSKAVKNSKKTVENTQKSLLNLQNRQKIKKKKQSFVWLPLRLFLIHHYYKSNSERSSMNRHRVSIRPHAQDKKLCLIIVVW